MYYPFEIKWTWALSINDFVMTLNLYLYIDHNYIELKYRVPVYLLNVHI